MFGLYQRNIASMKCILKPFSESETNWAQNIKQKQHLNENFNRTQAKNRWSNICIYVFKWIRFEYIMLYCWIGGRVYNILPFVNKTSTIPHYFRNFLKTWSQITLILWKISKMVQNGRYTYTCVTDYMDHIIDML